MPRDKILREGKAFIDVDEEYEKLKKEGRVETHYHQAMFEWTHFKADAEGCYLLPLIVAIINQIDNGKFEA